MNTIDSAVQEELARLVRQAGAKLMEYWPGALSSRGREGLHIAKKPDGSFVTEADYVSNDILTAALRQLFPADGILSEESEIDPALGQKERIWIIDPLDGTQTFIDGNDDFAILLALCNRGAMEFGMMYLPARDQFAMACKGRGATVNGVSMRVSQSSEIRPQALYLRHLSGPKSEKVFPRWLDSSAAFLRLCQGEFDGIVVKIVNHQEWDLATAAVLIEESGGKVTDEHGQKISFGSGTVTFTHFVASNGKVHQDLLRLLECP
ncbi:MAG: inositol monophosphatase [Deltaproteobacteria bacterium]|nr:inositol monophosphatase [Deltaproteobacteria bacterium]